ncbi:FIST signal transduction protein [Ideonella livida]|uniref:Histidine kinase n=1 Tax=Ideonella livida TaxID=2707176 RepID=A0A7C9PK23_9BURK|nr:FIST N-terminal domain-containing protein [Ideonella livida]NDY93868.1 hypothetical protein [Ideonella livida]
MALALAAAQLDGQRAAQRRPAPTLAWLYLTQALAPQAQALVDEVGRRWPGVQVLAAVAAGICATGVEYHDEPALVLMLADLPASLFQVFDGRHPLRHGQAGAALVHADPQLPELASLVDELADRLPGQRLFGGLLSSRGVEGQFAGGQAVGGLSGVAFAPQLEVRVRVSQGCQPLGPMRRLDRCEGNLAVTLDGQPALDGLLDDLGLQHLSPHDLARRLRGVLVGLTAPEDEALDPGGLFGPDTRVRHLVGVDIGQGALAVADDELHRGWQVGFCRRDAASARRDLVRMATELRELLDGDDDSGQPPRQVLGAFYLSCTGRGGAHFGGPSAELQILRQALGEVPLAGFFAAGEIAGRQLYTYSGVLALVLAPA